MLPNAIIKRMRTGFAVQFGMIRLAFDENERKAWKKAYFKLIQLSMLNRLINLHWKRQDVLLQELSSARSEKEQIEICNQIETVRDRTLKMVMYRFQRYDVRGIN